jgi:hypothetical protein
LKLSATYFSRNGLFFGFLNQSNQLSIRASLASPILENKIILVNCYFSKCEFWQKKNKFGCFERFSQFSQFSLFYIFSGITPWRVGSTQAAAKKWTNSFRLDQQSRNRLRPILTTPNVENVDLERRQMKHLNAKNIFI